jgi:hypothetical protein
VLGAIATSAVPASSSTGVGTARSDLQRARAELHALDLELSLAAQRLHEGKVLLATLRSDLAAARARSDRADLAAADAATSFDAMVRWAYESGASSQLAVLGLGSVSDLSDGVDLLAAMAGNQEQLAAAAVRARADAAGAADQSASLEAAVTRTLADQRAAGVDLRAAAARQRDVIAEVEQRLHHQITLAIADRRAAAAAERKAQQEAEERAQQQTTPQPTSPGGSTDPTSGPLPGPSEPIPTSGEVVDLVSSLWGDGPDGQVARCVAWRESRYQATARNSSSGAAGLFQLMPFWWDGNNEFGWRFDPYDANANAYHAHLIWKVYGWEPWTTGHLCV